MSEYCTFSKHETSRAINEFVFREHAIYTATYDLQSPIHVA